MAGQSENPLPEPPPIPASAIPAPTTPAPPAPPPPRRAWMNSPGAKAGIVLALLVGMLIPMTMVSSLVEERQSRQEAVRAEFRNSWGPAQVARGPILVVPVDRGGSRRYLHLLAEDLTVLASVVPETRKRGLFRATTYRAGLTFKGRFRITQAALADVADWNVAWKDSFLVLGATSWNGARLRTGFSLSGTAHAFDRPTDQGYASCLNADLIAGPAPLDPAVDLDTDLPFEAAVDVAGTEGLSIAPMARHAEIAIAAPWPTPSFDGTILPDSSVVTANDFRAVWHMDGRGAAGGWTSFRGANCSAAAVNAAAIANQAAGTQLLEAVPTYRMVYRASNYGILFLTLSFLTYFLFEAMRRVRIHVMQYGMLGLSMSLFALLLVSFAEPLGFTSGYAIASAAILGQASLFTLSVTRSAREAGIFASVLGGLFGFLYVVLIQESFALLAGSVALFAVLSVLMLVTRRLDWSKGLG